MNNLPKFIIFLLFSFTLISAAENFILIDGDSHETIMELGLEIDEQVTPCSTFKIALSLMGFDSGILQNEQSPVWLFQEGYDDFLESWKSPQVPQTWMKNSCIWFSKILAGKLGLENFQLYLIALDYGNQDASGGLTTAWINSSLKISPREQVSFIKKMMQGQLTISSYAIEKTKSILFIEELSNGWKLFGKTGWTGSNTKDELGWFVGWIEKQNSFFPFAYQIRENKINLPQRIPRVKQLLIDSDVYQKTGKKGNLRQA